MSSFDSATWDLLIDTGVDDAPTSERDDDRRVTLALTPSQTLAVHLQPGLLGTLLRRLHPARTRQREGWLTPLVFWRLRRGLPVRA